MTSNDFLSFGVSLGNSTCCISVNRNGNIDVVANASGERVTSAIVTFHETEVVTGTAAKQALVRHDRCTVVGALRAIGSKSTDKLVFPCNLKCHLSYDTKRPKYIIQNEDKTRMIPPEEALKNVLILLKDIASSHSTEDKLPVIITVPAWVSDPMTSIVHSVANAAGFHVIKTISQASASCLAYDLLTDNRSNMNVLMFHCGGTSIVATIGEISGGLLNIKETSYSLSSSGDAITSLLVDYLAKEFLMKYKGDPLENRRSKRKLYTVSENCKHVLSTMNSAQVYAESLWEGVDFSTQISRARYDGLISPILNEFLVPVKEVLQRSNLNYEQIDKVILTGGSCKIPKLQNLVSETFKNAEILKKFLPDEALAIGCAKETNHCRNGKSSIKTSSCLLSCLSQSIFAKVQERKDSQCIFPYGTPSHARHSSSFECSSGPCSLIFYEAAKSTEFPSEDQILAQVELNFLESAEPVNLQVECSLKSDGSLVIKLLEPSSKTNKSFIIEAERS